MSQLILCTGLVQVSLIISLLFHALILRRRLFMAMPQEVVPTASLPLRTNFSNLMDLVCCEAVSHAMGIFPL